MSNSYNENSFHAIKDPKSSQSLLILKIRNQTQKANLNELGL